MDGNRLQGEIVVCGVPFEKGEEEAKKALAKLKADFIATIRSALRMVDSLWATKKVVQFSIIREVASCTFFSEAESSSRLGHFPNMFLAAWDGCRKVW